jgi:hypothetical protein
MNEHMPISKRTVEGSNCAPGWRSALAADFPLPSTGRGIEGEGWSVSSRSLQKTLRAAQPSAGPSHEPNHDRWQNHPSSPSLLPVEGRREKQAERLPCSVVQDANHDSDFPLPSTGRGIEGEGWSVSSRSSQKTHRAAQPSTGPSHEPNHDRWQNHPSSPSLLPVEGRREKQAERLPCSVVQGANHDSDFPLPSTGRGRIPFGFIL